MRRILLVLIVSASTLAAAPVARASGYTAGVSVVTTTPPRTGNRVGSLQCPAAIFTGPSMWDFDEPYIDLNGNGVYDLPEPYCDANANGRYDGVWVVGAVGHHADAVLDDISVRTFVVSDGSRTIAVSSVDALGLFNSDVDVARALVRFRDPSVSELFVSADHNESSPDTIGLWGPDDPTGASPLAGSASVTSGVNDYYMTFLEHRIAESVHRALLAAKPATLHVLETTAPTIVPTLNHWPTTNRKDAAGAVPPPSAGRIDAWDPKVHILQARDEADANIFTLVDYDGHVQNLGHSDTLGRDITADWVRFFNDDVETAQGGVAIFLAGANGSIETPQVPSRRNAPEGTLERSEDIGHELASVVNASASDAVPLATGPVSGARRTFTIPLENQLFIAAFAAHLFPHKVFTAQTDDPASPYPHMGTEVGVAKIGPLELLANPGEAFPSLTKGSHWGIDEGCSTRPNPPVPSWHSSAAYRWDMGLANDMIGYESPAWSWDADQTTYALPTDPCANGTDEQGHHHSLEDESTGPTGANIVATKLTELITQLDGANANDIVVGRYVFADGRTSRRPYVAPYQHDDVASTPAVTESAVGMRFATTTVMQPDYEFVDFDGQRQDHADQHTMGMRPVAGGRTIFLDVYPAVG